MTGGNRISLLAFVGAALLLLQLGWADPAAAAEAPVDPVELNTASVEELCSLPGIGPKKAEAIVALRQKQRIIRPTQLLRVKGIGPKILEKLRPHIRIEPPPKAVTTPGGGKKPKQSPLPN